MRKFFLSLAFLVLGAAVSIAADLPTKAVAQAAPPDQPITWTGAYVGVVTGYGWDDQSIGVTGNSALSQSILNHNFYPSTINSQRSGAVLGVVGGYDYQIMPSIVIGGRVGYSYSGVRGTSSAGGNLVGVAYDENIKNIWDVFGRIGYLVPGRAQRVMVYVIGGWTTAEGNSTVTSSGLACGFVTCPSGMTSTRANGGTIGGGLEYRLDRNWSLSAEYLWTDLGTQNTPVGMTVGKTGLPFTDSAATKFNRALIELSYRF